MSAGTSSSSPSVPRAVTADCVMVVAKDAFKNLASVDLVDTETMTLPEIQDTLRRASLLYIPGGNTFLLNHRLHLSKLMPYLRKLVQTNMPLVAFSAGTVLCGQNILTSKDLNSVGTPYFDGLKAVPYNFLVHYGEDAYLQAIHDNWLADYHVFQDNPVVIMSDGAYVRVEGKKIFLERGNAWILRKGREKEKLEPGGFK